MVYESNILSQFLTLPAVTIPFTAYLNRFQPHSIKPEPFFNLFNPAMEGQTRLHREKIT